MKRIASIGNVIQKENPETKKVEYIPAFTIEIWNRIKDVNPQKDIDLQFDLSPASYETIFKKELNFETDEEMDACRKVLARIKTLDDSNEVYVILNSPFTNSIMILESDMEAMSVQLDDVKQYTYFVDILKWITEQEKYF